MRLTVFLVGLAGLAACGTAEFNDPVDLDATAEQLRTLDLLAETRREVDVAYRDLPFDSGPVYVVAPEHGDLHTYSLTPCRNGTRICGGAGGVGHVTRTPDYFKVTGAYAGRTFYLSPGGDGILEWQGVERELAWN